MDDNPVRKNGWLGSVVFILLFTLWILFFFIFSSVNNRRYRPHTIEDVTGIGKQTFEHEELLSRIREDLKIPPSMEIRVFLGPYLDFAGYAKIIRTDTAYIILIDQYFYEKLIPDERIAVIAHELGHLTNEPTIEYNRAINLRFQIEADTYATKYVSPEVMISLLNKVVPEYFRKYPEYKERIENLEKVKQLQQGSHLVFLLIFR